MKDVMITVKTVQISESDSEVSGKKTGHILLHIRIL